MKRILYNSLLHWKVDPDRKPLILEGARQVGKTWLLTEFGKNEFDNLVYVNCHDDPTAQKLFSQDLKVERILRDVEAITGEHVTMGTTLLFFDEIQEAPHGLSALKYFCEQARDLHVVVAGSLLGVTHRQGESYPVGKVDIMRLHPMTFTEFLWAMDKETLSQIVMGREWESLKNLDSLLQDLLRQYYYVGGMPEAVLSYTTRHDLGRVRTIQNNILSSYINDMAKHAAEIDDRIRLVWQSIPSQLAKENKKFIYGAVKKGGRARDFETAIQWLVDAGIVHRVHRCKVPEMPLKFYEDFDAFKLYLLDVGLLGALSGVSSSQILVNNEVFMQFKGAFTENYVLQQLCSFDELPIYYYSKENSMVEVDFVVQAPSRIIPIEVKAETNVKSKSLSQFINIDHATRGLKGLRCSMLPYVDQGWMENIPLYAIEGYLRQEVFALCDS
ncbi:MAG: ATP-binding protein [Muribaculaceae bacterium]|nr:ATP-binding protein [Muribaculaceae bacterium]